MIMNVLIVTDHIYLAHPSGIFDTYCFDNGFFEDYCQTFESVSVLCRMAKVEMLPIGANRSDGKRIQFKGVPNIRGIKWFCWAGWAYQQIVKSAVNASDAVIGRVPSQLARIASHYAQKMKKPCMIEVIGDPQEALVHINNSVPYRLVSWLEMLRLKQLTQIAEFGAYVSRHLREKYPIRNANACVVVSDIRLSRHDIKQEKIFLTCPTPIKIIQVASLLAYKRHQDLIQACRLVTDMGISIEIHFVGGGSRRQELETLCQQLRVGENIRFHGHVADRQFLIKLLDDSDLFVLTSATEGLPRAILEAMSRGLPVIATQIPGVMELIRESESFPVGDVKALANLIVILAKNPDRMMEMSHFSIETAKQYTNEILSLRRMHLYSLLREKAAYINNKNKEVL